MPIREDTPQSITDGMVDQQEDSEIILPLDQKIFFYQMYRPWYTGTKKRIDPIISSNNHINVFTIDPDEAYEFDGNIAEMEVASKLVISNTEEQEQKPIIRRKIVISERCEFLQNGNWAVALFEPIETEADLDRLWFFDSVSPKYGYAENDPDILNTQENVGYQTSALFGREYQVQEIYLTSKDYFSTENKTAIKLILGAPIDMTDYSLQKITFERNGSHSIYNQIKLLGLDTSANEKTFFPLKANLMPFLANVKKLGKEIELNNLWKKCLSFASLSSLLGDDYSGDNEIAKDLSYLLSLESTDTTGDINHKGYILSATINFQTYGSNEWETIRSKIAQAENDGWLLINDFGITDYKPTKGSTAGPAFATAAYENISQKNRYLYITSSSYRKLYTYSYKDKSDNTITWDGEETQNFGSPSSQHFFSIVNVANSPFGQVILYDTDNQQQISYTNARVKSALFNIKIDSTSSDSDNVHDNPRAPMRIKDANPNNAAGSQHFGDLPIFLTAGKGDRSTWSPFQKANSFGVTTIGGPEGDSDTWFGFNVGNATYSIKGRYEITVQLRWNDGSEADGGPYDIIIENNGVKDNMRLWNMLIRKIIWTKLYANGFSGANYDESTGLPINFAGIVKEKFTNTNYSPIDVITNIEKEYLLRYPDDKNTPQWELYKKISTMLSDIILSDASIAGGLNEQNEILQPFYFKLPQKRPSNDQYEPNTDNITMLAKWVDSENFISDDSVDSPLYIYGSNKPVDESKTNSFVLSGGTTAQAIRTQFNDNGSIKNLSIWGILKSKYFNAKKNVADYPKNEFVIEPTNNLISDTPTLTTDDEEITFSFMPATKELKEADFTEIPRDWSLNENYTNYLWNILLPETNYDVSADENGEEVKGDPYTYSWQEKTIGFVGGYGEITKTNYRSDIVSLIKDDLPVSIIVGEDTDNDDLNESGSLPYELIFNGTFGSETDLSFDFKTTQLNEDGSETILTKTIRIPNINIFNDTDDQVCETTLVM